MGVLTRYLDLLPPAARQRVLTATRWTTRWHVEDDGARNLMGHAENWSREGDHVPTCGAPDVFFLRRTAGDELWTDEPLIGFRFDRLVERCGMDRSLALIRARILRNRTPTPAPARVPAACAPARTGNQVESFNSRY